MQDLKTKTPNKRKSLGNATPKSEKKVKVETPKNGNTLNGKTPNKSPKNRKEAADFFGPSPQKSPAAMNGNQNKVAPQTEKKAGKPNKQNNKRKSLPAKLFENDSPKKAKIEESESSKVPMFGGTSTLTSPKKQDSPKKQNNASPVKKEATPAKTTPGKKQGNTTPAKKQGNVTPVKSEVVAAEQKPVSEKKKNKGKNNAQAEVKPASPEKAVEKKADNEAGEEKPQKDGEKRVHKRSKNKKKKKGAVVVPKVTEDGVPLNKRQISRMKTKLKTKNHQEKVEKLIDLVNKGAKKADDVSTNLKQKITELEARSSLTKTGKRRLRELRKVLILVENPNAREGLRASKPVDNKPKQNAKQNKKQVKKNEKKLTNLVKDQNEENDFWSADLKKQQQNENKKQKVENKQAENKVAVVNQQKGKVNQQKGANQPKAAGKNQPEKKPVAKVVPAKEEEDDDDEEDSSEESDYDVEKTIKPQKVTKTMNEFEKDSDEEEDDDDEEAEDDEELDENLENSGFIDEAAESGDDEEEEDGDEEEEDGDDDDDEEDEDDEIEVKKPQQKNQQKAGKGNQKEGNKQKEGNNKQNEKEKGGKKFAEVPVTDLQNGGMIQKGQSRYVVFAGNLPYDATKEELKSHFQKAGEVAHVRIPTEKGTQKPRGFAYVEFKDEESYQRALSMHHSMLKNRRINVLYTQGGKKKPEERKKEIKEKNFKLNAMRNKGMLAGSGSVKENHKRSMRRAKQKNANN